MQAKTIGCERAEKMAKALQSARDWAHFYLQKARYPNP